MTRVTRDLGDTMQEAVWPVSTDVSFISNHFPKYKIGANDRIIEVKEDPELPSMKDIVAKETAQLLEQQKRLSVRDLASKFEKGLAAATKLSDEAKFREVASLDRHVLLKKLRDVLESLKGRVAGRNKDDVEEAISMVEALAVQLTHREGELLQEKTELKKLASFLKQASEDAKKVVEDERAFARAEIESARAAVQRVEQALQEQEQISKSSVKQDMEELLKEVQEARRIKMLHQPSKVMDMEHELHALRLQLVEKSMYSLQLRKELERFKRLENSEPHLYELDGSETLGSDLRIIPCQESAPDILKCSIQWFRVLSEGGTMELITGATKSVYAPEPFDVGRYLRAEIVSNDQRITLATTGPIDPAAGLGSYVEALVRKPDTEFNVVVTQMNGRDHPSHSIHVFHVGKMRIKLCKGKITKAKEPYSTSMQLCGVRGGGNAVSQALFWQAKKGISFTLAFESERERNAAIMLARRFAFDCNIMLAGPAALGKQKPLAAAEGKNRRALGDIGNLVDARGAIEGKQLPQQISRPITRGFCAKLLANAQAAAAANQKPDAAVVDNGVKPKAAARQKAAMIKPEQAANVIEINSDSEEGNTKNSTNKKNTNEGLSRKNKVRTLTSILTARSKVACGIKAIEDIDAPDSENQLAVVDYVEDIYKFYRLMEASSRVHDYMGSQIEINDRMRSILVDWLIEVHNKFELMPETLYLTIHIVDRYLSGKTVPRRELQLVGIAAMLIASKYEEIWAPEINDFVCISDRTYCREQILIMEKNMLNVLEWSLTVPTLYVFLVRFLKAAVSDKEMEEMVFFYAELALTQYSMIVYCPSMIAASAVYAAQCTLKKSPLWSGTLRHHTGFSEAQIMDCAKLLVNFHSLAAESKLKVVYRKYSSLERGAVALLPPAKLEELKSD